MEKMFLRLKQLKQFLVESNQGGYASGREKNWVKEEDGSTTIEFEKGGWKSEDNFFGGEPYGGRTIVFKEGKPYWIMVYYGAVEEGVDPDEVYNFLREALKLMPEDYPFRGPRKFEQGKFVYTNSWKGEVERFSGEEKIAEGGKVVYQAKYGGGLVDRRRGV